MLEFGVNEKELQYNKEFLYFSQDELPKKVAAICHSVTKLYNEGLPFYKMTISDIAKEANIGKGTVYEYFNTKEEIIITAMLLEVKYEVQEICKVSLAKDTFNEKYYALVDWVEIRMKNNQLLRQMILARYSENSDKATCELISRMLNETKGKEVLDNLINSGIQEGLFKEPKSTLQKKSAFATLAFCIIALMQPQEFDSTPADIKEYSRSMFVQLLQ